MAAIAAIFARHNAVMMPLGWLADDARPWCVHSN
jgi:hypothetical protein